MAQGSGSRAAHRALMLRRSKEKMWEGLRSLEPWAWTLKRIGGAMGLGDGRTPGSQGGGVEGSVPPQKEARLLSATPCRPVWSRHRVLLLAAALLAASQRAGLRAKGLHDAAARLAGRSSPGSPWP